MNEVNTHDPHTDKVSKLNGKLPVVAGLFSSSKTNNNPCARFLTHQCSTSLTTDLFSDTWVFTVSHTLNFFHNTCFFSYISQGRRVGLKLTLTDC